MTWKRWTLVAVVLAVLVGWGLWKLGSFVVSDLNIQPAGGVAVTQDSLGVVGHSQGPVRGGNNAPESGGGLSPDAVKDDLVYFESYGVNPFVDADEDRLSTFALDGDTASYEVSRNYFRRGLLPNPDSVRVEEWVNSFAQGFDAPDEGLALVLDGGPSRFGEEGYQLLRVGVAAARPEGEREPVSLVFVVDVSGSMGLDDRLEVAKATMLSLTDLLSGRDRVALVTYGSEAEVRHSWEAADSVLTLRQQISGLAPEGSTFVEAGIRKAYVLAEPEVVAGRNVRLVVFSDGLGNVGETGPEEILALVDERVGKSVTLTTVGFGASTNYNDAMLEILANRGNGTYHYVRDRAAVADFMEKHAESIFREVARDARIQVEFNPEVVRKYRLLGYENRAVADEDFRDDTLDFGEIGFANDVAALYEVRLEDGVDGGAELATARLRWFDVSKDAVVEVESSLAVGDLAVDWASMDAHLRRVAGVAEFAELMRKSFWAQCGSPADVLTALEQVSVGDGQSEELVEHLQFAEQEFVPFCTR